MGRFYRLWLWRAVRHTVGIADLLASLAGSAAAVLVHFYPAAGTLVASLAWQVPLWAAGAVVLLRLLLAPYWIWQEDQARLADLRGVGDRKKIRARLGQFINEAERLKALLVANHDLAEIAPATDDWRNRLGQFLVEELDESYAARLNSNAGILSGEPTGFKLEEQGGRWRWLNYRSIRLQEFVRELT